VQFEKDRPVTDKVKRSPVWHSNVFFLMNKELSVMSSRMLVPFGKGHEHKRPKASSGCRKRQDLIDLGSLTATESDTRGPGF